MAKQKLLQTPEAKRRRNRARRAARSERIRAQRYRDEGRLPPGPSRRAMENPALHPAVYAILGVSAVAVVVGGVALYMHDKKLAATKASTLALNGATTSTTVPSSQQLASAAFITAAQVELVDLLNPNSLTPPYSAADETGVADLRFGQALALYQSQAGLPVTGVLDSATWLTLASNAPAA
jgi:hypothetical protein